MTALRELIPVKTTLSGTDALRRARSQVRCALLTSCPRKRCMKVSKIHLLRSTRPCAHLIHMSSLVSGSLDHGQSLRTWRMCICTQALGRMHLRAAYKALKAGLHRQSAHRCQAVCARVEGLDGTVSYSALLTCHIHLTVHLLSIFLPPTYLCRTPPPQHSRANAPGLSVQAGAACRCSRDLGLLVNAPGLAL